MKNINRPVAVVGAMRIPFVKSFREYSRVSNQEMLTATLQALINKYKLNGGLIGDVALGAIMNSSKDWNLSREVVLGTDLDARTPAFNVQRACGTSLEAVNLIALKISSGQIDSGIAGGSDTNSDLPIMASQALAWKLIDANQAKSFGQRVSKFLTIKPSDLKPVYPNIVEPRTGMSMGQHTERMVKQWNVSREEQDALALVSHQRAAKAYSDGFYDDMLAPFKDATRDTIVRADTTLQKLGALKPAFDKSGSGTLTAGNSTLFTDGAASVLLASEEYATRHGLAVQAYVTDVQATAIDFVHGAGLLMAPTVAVAQLLKRNNLTLQDFDFYEIHEAFSGQVLCTLKAWESDAYCRNELHLDGALGAIDRSKMNVKGGSVALGHPFGATGARVVANMAKLLSQKGSGRGLVSVCTAGGMGVAAILER
ncbi:MAG: acetyl-CoA C-acetyltransferase [Bacteroidia bacterium]|nr:acetyl-CoA C-acetyltransferase [Bacteroidia bacterium]